MNFLPLVLFAVVICLVLTIGHYAMRSDPRERGRHAEAIEQGTTFVQGNSCFQDQLTKRNGHKLGIFTAIGIAIVVYTVCTYSYIDNRKRIDAVKESYAKEEALKRI